MPTHSNENRPVRIGRNSDRLTAYRFGRLPHSPARSPFDPALELAQVGDNHGPRSWRLVPLGGVRRPGGRGDPRHESRYAVRTGLQTVYHVRVRHAGRRARLRRVRDANADPGGARVGVETTLPRPSARAVARSRESDAARRGRREVRIGCIGRGHAGKTALFQVLGDSLVGDYLPSGLHLDAADPREVARMIREAEDAQRLLQRVRPAADARSLADPLLHLRRGRAAGRLPDARGDRPGAHAHAAGLRAAAAGSVRRLPEEPGERARPVGGGALPARRPQAARPPPLRQRPADHPGLPPRGAAAADAHEPAAVALVLSKTDALFAHAGGGPRRADRRRAPSRGRAARPPDRAVDARLGRGDHPDDGVRVRQGRAARRTRPSGTKRRAPRRSRSGTSRSGS